MIAPWTNEYVGIPYRLHGRDRAGCDCWGLIRLVLEKEFGVLVPSFSGEYVQDAGDYARIIDANISLVDAVEVIEPAAGDLILCRICGMPCHVGIYAGNGYMLHTLTAHDSALALITSSRWACRIEGFYRVR